MELLFKSNQGVKLLEDLDHTLVSSNPAHVYESLLKDSKQSKDIIAKFMAIQLLSFIAERGGIYMRGDVEPLIVNSEDKSIYMYKDGKDQIAMCVSSAYFADCKVREEMEFPILCLPLT